MVKTKTRSSQHFFWLKWNISHSELRHTVSVLFHDNDTLRPCLPLLVSISLLFYIYIFLMIVMNYMIKTCFFRSIRWPRRWWWRRPRRRRWWSSLVISPIIFVSAFSPNNASQISIMYYLKSSILCNCYRLLFKLPLEINLKYIDSTNHIMYLILIKVHYWRAPCI